MIQQHHAALVSLLVPAIAFTHPFSRKPLTETAKALRAVPKAKDLLLILILHPWPSEVPFHHFMVNMTKHCCQFEPDVKIHKKFLNAYDMEFNHGEETFAVPWTKSSAELCESPTDGSVFLPLIESVGKSRPPLQKYYRNRSLQNNLCCITHYGWLE